MHIYCVVHQDQFPGYDGIAFVSDRMSNSGSTFSPFRQFAGPGINPSAPVFASVGVPTTYSIREAWTPWLGSNVFRGFVTPEQRRDNSPNFDGSGWTFVVQDKTGAWNAVTMGTGTPDAGSDYDPPDWARDTTPSFLPVGEANAEMFACVTGRTLDDTGRTTWLVKLTPPNGGTSPTLSEVQDLLFADNHWAQISAPGAPLTPRPGPPHPQ